MCGRFVVAKSLSELVTIFEVDEVIDQVTIPNFNIAPTTNIAMIVDRSFEKDESGAPIGELSREIHAARWGLVPRWSKGPNDGPPLFNARIETIAEKPSFKDAVIRRRCVIPASGYYEWQVAPDGSKHPIYINAGPDGLFAFAGIYEWWADPSKPANDPKRWLLSTTVVTKAAAKEISHIHDRNPVLLSPDTIEEWLDPNVEASEDLLHAVSSDSDRVAAEAEFFEVSPEVGKVSSNGAGLILPA